VVLSLEYKKRACGLAPAATQNGSERRRHLLRVAKKKEEGHGARIKKKEQEFPSSFTKEKEKPPPHRRQEKDIHVKEERETSGYNFLPLSSLPKMRDGKKKRNEAHLRFITSYY